MSAQFEPGRMSKFIKGQTIRCINDRDQGTTANESLAYGAEYVIAETSGFAVRLADGDAFWDEDRFTAALAPEPEDKDDLYVEPEHVTEPSVDNSEGLTEPEDADDVEPEPLKHGQWVQAWAQVDHVRDGGRVALFFERETHAFIDYADVYPDAIVRPAAGDLPPWVKPAQCTSLVARIADSLPVLMRCEGEAGHQTMHVVGWVAWTDDEEYGRMVESGGAS